jgi:hypothetical protein
MLSNILGEMGEYRDIILNSEIYTIVLELSTNSNNMLRNNIAAFLLNSIKDNENLNNTAIYEITRIIVDYIYSTNEQLNHDCLEALKIISDKEINIKAIFIESQLINRILAFDIQSHPEYIIPILIIIGNILSLDDSKVIKYMIDLNILDFLMTFFEYKSRKIKKELIWVISNLAGDTGHNCKFLLESEIMRHIMKFAMGNDLELKKEALMVISNISSIKALSLNIDLTRFGIFGMLIDNFNNVVDSEILEICLFILNNMFESALPLAKIRKVNSMALKFEEIGGVSSLEKLLSHYNHIVYKFVEGILQTYFKDNLL